MPHPVEQKQRRDWPYILKMVLLLGSLIGNGFMLGYNWRRVDELTDWKVRAESSDQGYVRKDVLSQQIQGLTQQMQSLNETLQRQIDRIDTHKP